MGLKKAYDELEITEGPLELNQNDITNVGKVGAETFSTGGAHIDRVLEKDDGELTEPSTDTIRKTVNGDYDKVRVVFDNVGTDGADTIRLQLNGITSSDYYYFLVGDTSLSTTDSSIILGSTGEFGSRKLLGYIDIDVSDRASFIGPPGVVDGSDILLQGSIRETNVGHSVNQIDVFSQSGNTITGTIDVFGIVDVRPE